MTKKKKKKISQKVLSSTRLRFDKCQNSLVSRDKQRCNKCGMGKVYLLLANGSEERGSPSGDPLQLSQIQNHLKETP